MTKLSSDEAVAAIAREAKRRVTELTILEKERRPARRSEDMSCLSKSLSGPTPPPDMGQVFATHFQFESVNAMRPQCASRPGGSPVYASLLSPRSVRHQRYLRRSAQTTMETSRPSCPLSRPHNSSTPRACLAHQAYSEDYLARFEQLAACHLGRVSESALQAHAQRLQNFIASLDHEDANRPPVMTPLDTPAPPAAVEEPAQAETHAAPLPSLRTEAPHWWTPPPLVDSGIEEYDREEQIRRTAALRALEAAEPARGGRGDTPAQRCGFVRRMREVARHRLIQREVIEEVDRAPTVVAAPRVEKARWSLQSSIWRGRAARAYSQDFYDGGSAAARIHVELLQRALRCDDGKLAQYALRHDDGEDDAEHSLPAMDLAEIGKAADGGISASSELRELQDVLIKWGDVVWTAFDYYAVNAVSRAGFKLETHPAGFVPYTFATKHEYTGFVEDAELFERGSQHCSSEHLAQLFRMLITRARSEPPAVNPKNMLNRREWLEALVRITVMRYVLPGQVPDLSDAFDMLLTKVSQTLPRVWMKQCDSDAFRTTHCYTKSVSAVLSKHEPMLRALFDAFAQEPKPKPNDLPNPFATPEGLSWDNWHLLVEALDWIDSGFVLRDACNVFVWTRMRVFDDGSIAARRKAMNMWPEDFFEAVVRVATMKPTPTMEEAIYAGFSDCGEYLLDLKHNPAADKNAFQSFLDRNQVVRGEAPTQDSEELVEHMCMLIKRTIEHRLSEASKTARSDDKDLTKGDIQRFHTLSKKVSAFKVD